MIDADGASEISEFEKCVEKVFLIYPKNFCWIFLKIKLRQIEKDGHGLVAGSRNHEEDDLVKGRFSYRMFLSKCSNFIVQTLIGVKLKVYFEEK